MTERATIHVVGISGGKDSTATAKIALDQNDPALVRLVAADTGNEHPLNWEYIDYLRGRFNHPIDVVRADFTAELARKRAYVMTVWPAEGVPLEICERAAAILAPTGNPFLDLCLWKGRFPSAKAQFCTEELKRYPLEAYQTAIITSGHAIEVWQGVRRDESPRRAHVLEREQSAEGWWVNRPLAFWTSQQAVDFLLAGGIELNPLYKRGFKRVGCAPCINSGKDDLSLWARTFPPMIDKIREWERLVALASKRSRASFRYAPAEQGPNGPGTNIDENVAWALTTRGGAQYDLLKAGEVEECSSVYGLCE